MLSLNEPNGLFRFQRATVDDPRTVRQRMLGFDFTSLDCQPKRNAAHVEMIRSLGKSEPAFGCATVGAIRGNAVMAA
jgi:hypothetical protein